MRREFGGGEAERLVEAHPPPPFCGRASDAFSCTRRQQHLPPVSGNRRRNVERVARRCRAPPWSSSSTADRLQAQAAGWRRRARRPNVIRRVAGRLPAAARQARRLGNSIGLARQRQRIAGGNGPAACCQGIHEGMLLGMVKTFQYGSLVALAFPVIDRGRPKRMPWKARCRLTSSRCLAC